ncbi:hypothetical protein LOAG_09846 [Loa loa]|uniref:Uncharacterized protein n=1 Tax=Loa loa TaxID=7209 RepID=A0A1S0TRM1_LOALO|nr:hypothetical protein LOAG_09846 [Loa loa]EFO18650.1 hypothetical protein LOAG_09846 [Loa loa]
MSRYIDMQCNSPQKQLCGQQSNTHSSNIRMEKAVRNVSHYQILQDDRLAATMILREGYESEGIGDTVIPTGSSFPTGRSFRFNTFLLKLIPYGKGIINGGGRTLLVPIIWRVTNKCTVTQDTRNAIHVTTSYK